jgi:hypothetical protein
MKKELWKLIILSITKNKILPSKYCYWVYSKNESVQNYWSKKLFKIRRNIILHYVYNINIYPNFLKINGILLPKQRFLPWTLGFHGTTCGKPWPRPMTLRLYFRILLREVCRTVTFYFHPFKVLSIIFLVQPLISKKVCGKRVGC